MRASIQSHANTRREVKQFKRRRRQTDRQSRPSQPPVLLVTRGYIREGDTLLLLQNNRHQLQYVFSGNLIILILQVWMFLAPSQRCGQLLLPQQTFIGATFSRVVQIAVFCTCTDGVQRVHLFMGVKGFLSFLYFRIEPSFTFYNQLICRYRSKTVRIDALIMIELKPDTANLEVVR